MLFPSPIHFSVAIGALRHYTTTSMNPETAKKLSSLKERLSRFGSATVALSGGTDSSFLASAAREALGDRAVAITVDSPFSARDDIRDAAAVAASLGLRHVVLKLDPLENDAVTSNTPDRCYHCKKLIFTAIREYADGKSIDAVLDGSNDDDTGDYRPGKRALRELGIVSPLLEAGLKKSEIRELAKERGLPLWDKPSSSCLAARIPYGDRISPEALAMIEAAEGALRSRGFRQVRVRHHGTLARIEVEPAEISRFADPALRQDIIGAVKIAGYRYVSLDLEGYRSGSMNEVLDKGETLGQG